MVNGPCPFNQRTICRFRTDAWMGFIRRKIDDINSHFIKVASASLDYILGLMEGEGIYPFEADVPDRQQIYHVTQFFASNLTPRMLFQKMSDLIKRLVMYSKMKSSPGFRKSILAKVNKKRIEEQKRLLSTSQITQKMAEDQLQKYKAIDSVFTEYEDCDSIIT